MTVRRPRASFATVTSLLAISIALGGTAYATSSLPQGSVGTAQLQKGAVTSGKVKNGTLNAVDFDPRQILKGARGPADPATAWRAFVLNSSGADAPIKVTAVCAPIG